MITIKDIAQMAGVSKTTVSRVLSQPPEECTVSEPLQRKVRGVAKKYGYQPNLMARGLATSRTGNIGFVIYRYEHLTHPVMTQVLSGVAEAISPSSYSLLIKAIDQPSKGEQKPGLSGLFARRQVDGLIIVAHQIDPIEISELIKEEHPFVLANFYVPGFSTDYVRVNFEEVSHKVISFFGELGHKEIAVFPGPKTGCSLENQMTKDFITGIYTALTKEKLQQVTIKSINYTKYDEKDAYAATLDMLKRGERPSAVYARDDAIAIGVLKAVQDYGLSVPADISIISGADTQTVQLTPVPLSAVSIPYAEIGFNAAEILLAKLQQETTESNQVFLPFDIIERQSSGPCNR